MNYGYVRVAACQPVVALADPMANAAKTIELVEKAVQKGAQVAAFPELGLTGYTCRDLFLQTALQKKGLEALGFLVAESVRFDTILVVGLPFPADDQLFNVAAVVCKGRLLALVPKSYLPGYKEFEEHRWFAPASRLRSRTVKLFGQEAPIGTDIIVSVEDLQGASHFKLGVEICEDLWMPVPPSSHLALHGATVLVNISASNELVGKADYRSSLVESQSARCIAAYVYSSCGVGESTADVVFSGHALVAENGHIVAESERFCQDAGFIVADVDVERLQRERRLTGSFGEAVGQERSPYREVACKVGPADVSKVLLGKVNPYPFIPVDEKERAAVCQEVFSIQTAGLAHRLRHISNAVRQGNQVPVFIGLSGGLDSTLALLATVKTFDLLSWGRQGITAVTMPGFGTSRRTKNNAVKLAKALGVKLREIPVSDAVCQHLRDIGHEPCGNCVRCDNAQARERTQILMDLGFTIGTGDLSEIALGWCTYNGDQYSMYNVNCGAPKTLVRYIVEWVAREQGGEIQEILSDVLATPIGGELRNLGPGEAVTDDAERRNGPYEVQDFFLYHVVRHGVAPKKALFLACEAWGKKYTNEDLRRWLEGFYRMFFIAQYKRDGAPNGPKVGSVSLSQRGDWRMPSDVSHVPWLSDLNMAGPE